MTSDRFHVFTNLAISFDGKITTSRREHIEPSKQDAYLMDVNRRRAHALLIGAGTLRTFRQPNLVHRKHFQLWRKARRLNPHPINVVLATKIDFDPSWPFFTSPFIERVLVVPDTTPESALKAFQPLAHIFRYDHKQPVPQQILGYLKKLGCRNLLIEGGGGTMFPWVADDLIDEWNVTVCPRVIGGENAPTMVEGEGFDAAHIRGYRLAKAFRRGNEVFLKYRRL